MTSTWKEIGKSLSRAWETLAEGWRELLSRSGDALTRFMRQENDDIPIVRDSNVQFPNWGLLSGEVMETDKSVVVRLEVPGIEKEDCDISLEGNQLYIRGQKRFDREHVAENYYVMERAYGSFERAIALPRTVDIDSAEASYKNGVLTVILPKVGGASVRRIAVK